ncbi:hypothetical protein RI054_19g87610 [Pseudoscourfieldia marina]
MTTLVSTPWSTGPTTLAAEKAEMRALRQHLQKLPTGASLRVLPPAMRASSTRLSRVHVSETDAPEKKKFNIQAGFGVMFMRVA